MTETFIVSTSTGLKFAFKDRWMAEGKQKELQTAAGELRVGICITLKKESVDGETHKTETISTWESTSGPQ